MGRRIVARDLGALMCASAHTWIWISIAVGVGSGPAAASCQPRLAESSSVATRDDRSSADAALWRLLSPPASGPTPSVVDMSQRVGKLGREAIPIVIGILLGEVTEPDSDVEVHPIAIEKRAEILMASLRYFPNAAVREHLLAKSASAAPLDVKLLVVSMWAEVGGAPALEAVLAIGKDIEPIHWMRTYVQVPIEDALARILARDRSLQKLLATQTAKLDVHLCPLVVRAVGRVGSPMALPWLASLIGRDSELDVVVVEEIVRLADHAYCDVGAAELAKLRSLLDSRDTRLQRSAATGLGSLGDSEACPRLVTLLGSRDAALARAAHWSLTRLTGQNLPAEAEVWASYCATEREWFDAEWATRIDELRASDPATVAEAVGDLLLHPLFKNRVALELRPLLGQDDPALSRLAAGVLGAVGSRRAVPWLIESLNSPDDALRSNAWRSLRALTGRDFPPTAESWASLASN